MKEKSEYLIKEVRNHFKDTQYIYLATCDGTKPRVRPVTLVLFNDRFWVLTGTNNAKINQIKANKNIEFCLQIKRGKNIGYIRGSGEARFIQDSTTRKLIADNVSYFKDYWQSPNDPGFALLEIIIDDIEYLRPGELSAERFSI